VHSVSNFIVEKDSMHVVISQIKGRKNLARLQSESFDFWPIQPRFLIKIYTTKIMVKCHCVVTPH